MEQRAARGKRTPALENRIEVYSDLQPVWEIFHYLSAARTAGFAGPNPLTVSDIVACLQLMGVDSNRGPAYARFIQSLDRTYLEYISKKHSKLKSDTDEGEGGADTSN